MDSPGPALNARGSWPLIGGGAAGRDRCARRGRAGVRPPGDAAGAPLAGGTTTFNPADFGNVPEVCPACARHRCACAGELVDASGRARFLRAARGQRDLPRAGPGHATDLGGAVHRPSGRAIRQQRRPGRDRRIVRPGHDRFPLDRRRPGPRGAGAVTRGRLLPIDTARQVGGRGWGWNWAPPGGSSCPGTSSLDGGLTLAAPVDFVAGQAHGQLRPDAAGGRLVVAQPAAGAGRSVWRQPWPPRRLRLCCLLVPRVGASHRSAAPAVAGLPGRDPGRGHRPHQPDGQRLPGLDALA